MENPKQNNRRGNVIVYSLSTNWPQYFKGFREGFWEEISQMDKNTNKTDTQHLLESVE